MLVTYTSLASLAAEQYTTIPRRGGGGGIHQDGGGGWINQVDAKSRGIYLALFTDLERYSCFSIKQIIWIKMKKVTFCKLKMSLSRNFITIYKHFGDFVKCISTILFQIRHENNFLPTS